MGLIARLKLVIEQVITYFLTGLLTRPLASYEQRVPNSLENLKQQLRLGDVILVEGDQRVSMVIRYLTQSSWSHTAIYIGDELRKYDSTRAAELDAKHGADAQYLILEADNDDGVSCVPVAKYVSYNIRVCRPRNLRPDDVDRVLKNLFAKLGFRYNFRHIFELALYFFPVSIIPRKFRKAILHYGSETKHEVICSTLLARAFGVIGYPILPRVTVEQASTQPTLFGRLLGRNGQGFHARYKREDAAMITPRDFDLSPYFDVVKCNYLTTPKFDYRQIDWATEDHPETSATADTDAQPVQPAAAARKQLQEAVD